jgi:hypothetical protein
MGTTDESGSEKSNAQAVKFKWIGIISVTLIIILYAVFNRTPVNEISVDKDGFKVKFSVKPIDQPEGQLENKTVTANSNQSEKLNESGISVIIPGEGKLSLSEIDNIVIEPGENDVQNRHLELVRTVLERAEIEKKYDESDDMGKFSIWITSSEIIDDKNIIDYITLFKKNDGTMEIAFREAYKQDGVWLTQISTFLKELLVMQNEYQEEINNPVQLDKPRIKSFGQINKCLELSKVALIRGQITPLGLLNSCFVDGALTNTFINQSRTDTNTVAKEIGLTFDLCMDIAEFGYSLYLEGEYLGSKIFWEAMIILNQNQAYFYNMYGACLENLNNLNEALQAYEKAFELDPDEENAKNNVKRLTEKLSDNKF